MDQIRMNVTKSGRQNQLISLLSDFRKNPITLESKIQEFLSLADAISRSQKGILFLYEHILEIEAAGVFKGTPWENTKRLVPSLVQGTLISGFPNSVYEILSELRILKIIVDQKDPDVKQDAEWFFEGALVQLFELAFREPTEETRNKLSDLENTRLKNLFDFIIERTPVIDIQEKLAVEIEMISAQRPIVTTRMEEMIKLAYNNFRDESESKNSRLEFYTNALYQPSENCEKHHSEAAYREFISSAQTSVIKKECKTLAQSMTQSGLVSDFHVILLNQIATHHTTLVPVFLQLNPHGRAEYKVHETFIIDFIKEYITKQTRQSIYGLSELLNRNLLSRESVFNGLNKLMRCKLHPKVNEALSKAFNIRKNNSTTHHLLVCGTVNILGRPLGVSQGNNPTCQSARGISMWSRHSPAKLLNIIIDAATYNELHFRYGAELITSKDILDTTKFDYRVDPVSAVLVPHLDHIYQVMIQKAQFKYPHEDPHVSVNPAFYGQWIQTGFKTAYNPLTGWIYNYNEFVRYMYASFHPKYNGEHQLVYPVPLGIYITNAHGEFLGYHAISLLRVHLDDAGIYRAYFFNPNSEGRQDWGQEIKPSVMGHGEIRGESSLPFYQFASRVYAFHFNSSGVEQRAEKVTLKEIHTVEKLARESWGRKYIWK